MLKEEWIATAAAVTRFYHELDQDVARFAQQTGMSCVPGCGACCLSPHVETTVAEMLPLALLLFAEGKVEETWERLQQGHSTCVQYAAEPGNPERGRCRTYGQRPILCRLFGYAGSRDKSGQLRYGACRVLQSAVPQHIQAIDAKLKESQLDIPLLAPAHERMAELAGPLGQDMMPINEALLKAIEKVGLVAQLELEQAGSDVAPLAWSDPVEG